MNVEKRYPKNSPIDTVTKSNTNNREKGTKKPILNWENKKLTKKNTKSIENVGIGETKSDRTEDQSPSLGPAAIEQTITR